ncbi:TetR/AcrR family transcriptional regulator [Nocardiopsis alba]|uniref:TetR/AcrR family transcriptional regulator n=1 Tax=Nocardiopsis alba TaxID=53437 RepID=UPI0033D4AF9D
MQPDNSEDDRKPSFVEEARRRQIVTAAIETIAEEGYSKASFARIARRASISPGLITYHFKTRERLLAAILHHIDSRLDRAMEGGPEPLEGFSDGLGRIVGGHVRYCSEHPEEMSARQNILNADLPEGLRASVAGTRDSGRAELAGFLAEGARYGEFRVFDPEVFVDTLFAALSSVPHRLAELPRERHEDYARELAELFVHAAVAPAPPEGAPPEETG